jgi:hypothetical protein
VAGGYFFRTRSQKVDPSAKSEIAPTFGRRIGDKTRKQAVNDLGRSWMRQGMLGVGMAGIRLSPQTVNRRQHSSGAGGAAASLTSLGARS